MKIEWIQIEQNRKRVADDPKALFRWPAHKVTLLVYKLQFALAHPVALCLVISVSSFR